MFPGPRRYETTNNIVVVGSTKANKKVAQQDLPSAKSVECPDCPVPCQVTSIPYQSYNSGLPTPAFNQNATQQYWPPTTPSYAAAAPPSVGSFHWGHPYEGTPVPQNSHHFVIESGQIHNNQPYETGHMTHDIQPFGVAASEIVHNSQPFTVGTGEMVHSRPFTVGTGEMIHSQPFAVGTREMIHYNQPFAVEPGEMIYNDQPFAITHSEMVHSNQPVAIGPGEMVQNNQTFAVGTGNVNLNMAHERQPLTIGTREMTHNNYQTYAFGTEQMANVTQHCCPIINGQVPVPQDSRPSLENVHKYQNSYSSHVQTPYTEPIPHSTTTAEANPLKHTHKKRSKTSLEPAKKHKLNSDDFLTGAANPARPDAPVREKKKSPVSNTPPLRINKEMKKESESPSFPLQRIKLADGKIINSKHLKSTFNNDVQETNKPSTSYKIKKIKSPDTMTAAVKKHCTKGPKGSSITKPDAEYCNKRLRKSTVEHGIPDKVLTKREESKGQPKKANKKKSDLIENLKLKLRKVDEEIRRRQIDLTIKNKLIKEKRTSIKSNSNDDHSCVSKNKKSKDEEANRHSSKKTEFSESREYIKCLTKIHSESASNQKEPKVTKKKINIKTKTEEADEKKSKVRSLVKVVKRLKNSEANQPRFDKENFRTHKEKYYIIQQLDLKRSIHNTAKPDKDKPFNYSKCKIKCRNTVFNTNHEDLVIMFKNKDQEDQTQERKVKVQKRNRIDESDSEEHLPNSSKIRKTEMTINVKTKKCEQDIDISSESESLTDLSFLDDINVDEIVDYLNSSKKQANCESDISHITLNSSNAFAATASPVSLIIDETIDVDRYEPIRNSNLDETMIIDVKEEGRDSSLSNNEIETETLVPILTISEIGSNDQQVFSPVEAPALIIPAPTGTVSRDDLINVSSNRVINTPIYEESTKGFTEHDKHLSDDGKDPPRCCEINNNNRATLEKTSFVLMNVELARHNASEPCSAAGTGDALDKSVIVEKKEPDVIIITDEAEEKKTITDVDMTKCKASAPEVITITDDTEEVITIHDEAQEVITIHDEAQEVITIFDVTEEDNTIINESQECIVINDGTSITIQEPTVNTLDNVEIPKIITSVENSAETTRIKENKIKTSKVYAIKLKDNLETEKEIRQANLELKEPREIKEVLQELKVKEEELLNITEVPQESRQDVVIKDESETYVLNNSLPHDIFNEENRINTDKLSDVKNKNIDTELKDVPKYLNLSSDLSVKIKNCSCTSEDRHVKISDISIKIKDKTSVKETDRESARSETIHNNILFSKTDIGQCEKSPCKVLHEIVEKKQDQSCIVTKAKTLVKTNKSFFTQQYIEKITALAKKGTVKEFKDKAYYLEQLASQEKEVGLALKLRKRVSDYMNLDLHMCSVLHRGRFSILFNCIDPEGLHVTAKITNGCSHTNTNTKEAAGYKKETMLLKLQDTIPKDKLDLVFLINGLAVDGRWCLLMDYYPKNLEQALRESGRGLHINLVHKLTKQLVSAVATLRNNGIVHSDIKPPHILLNADNTTLKLCGFDESYYFGEAQKRSNIGTIHYRAPEVILGHSAGHSIDVWATAVVLYEMAAGQKLYPGTSNNEVLHQHLSTLGGTPWALVQSSAFKDAHYKGQKFRRRHFLTENNDTKMIYEEILTFPKTKTVARSLFKAYTRNWCKVERDNDVMKLHQLYGLLSKMLVMDPRSRISILNANIK